MGLFSSKKKTYVSSSLYNLSGDDARERPKFVASLVIGAVLSNRVSIASTIRSGILNSPGAQQKKFFKWVSKPENYPPGLPDAIINGASDIAPSKAEAGVRSALGIPSNVILRVSTATLDQADIHYWAQDYVHSLYERDPEDPESEDRPVPEWSADFKHANNTITVQIAGESDINIGAPGDFIWGIEDGNRYLIFADYTLSYTDPLTLVVTETKRKFMTYRVGSGNVILDNLASSIEPMEEFFPALPIRLWNLGLRDGWMVNGYYSHVSKAFKKAYGSKLDPFLDEFEDNENLGDIDFAFIVHGVPLNTQDNAAKEYLFKFFQQMRSSQKYTKADGEAHKRMLVNGIGPAMEWARWSKANESNRIFYEELLKSWEEEEAAGADDENYVKQEAPSLMFAWPSPDDPETALTPAPNNQIRIQADNPTEYDHRINWNWIEETQEIGNGKTHIGVWEGEKLKVGEYWLGHSEDRPILTARRVNYGKGEVSIEIETEMQPRFVIVHQHDDFRYTKLSVAGLQHENYIYQGHAVRISAREAVKPTPEGEDVEESGFLIPLHYPTLQDMSVVKISQMTTSTQYLVLNAYEVVKIKWYQRGIFKIFMAVAIIAVSIILTPAAGLAAAGGILGGNIAVGVALGASLATAAIVGAAVNAIAAIVVTSLIQRASTKLFGSRWGQIIGTIASFIAINYGNNFIKTGSFNIEWGEILDVKNIMAVTDSASQAYQMWMQADTMDIIKSMEQATLDYEQQMSEIKKVSDEVLGMTSGFINPMMFTDVGAFAGESSESFLSRTLLTGSDIAELSFGMIENFSEVSKILPGDLR